MIRGLVFIFSAVFLFPLFAVAGNPGAQFIHATVTWEDGESRTGYLRWEDEEATWDDLFHCGYRESPWEDFIDHKALKKEKRTRYYETHGLFDRLAYALNEEDEPGPGWRMFLIRFGDIREFEIHSGKDDFITTADGSRHRIGGYANDNGSDLWLYENGEQPLEISWNDLVSIKFSAAPEGFPPFAERLHGTVQTTSGSFTGPIMWDKSECLSIDTLDGKNDEGDLSIAMGKIRSIEKNDSRSVRIVEKNGANYLMSGSNDVNNDNRGIWILSNEQGWVNVPWKRFRKVTFQDGPIAGHGRNFFGNSQPLQGTVHLKDGTRHQGRLVYDLDEGFKWDIFNGSQGQIDYDIPFKLITRIESLPEATCIVHLANGDALELSGNQDTGQDHGGILIFPNDNPEAEYIPWRLIKMINFISDR